MSVSYYSMNRTINVQNDRKIVNCSRRTYRIRSFIEINYGYYSRYINTGVNFITSPVFETYACFSFQTSLAAACVEKGKGMFFDSTNVYSAFRCIKRFHYFLAF